MSETNHRGRDEEATRLEEAWALRDNDPGAASVLLEANDGHNGNEFEAKLVASRLTMQAFLLSRKGHIGKALALALEADSLLSDDEATTWSARNNLLLGNLYTGVPNARVIDFLGRAIRQATEIDDRDLLFGAHHDLALHFAEAHDWSMAAAAFNKAEAFVDGNVDRQSFIALNRAETLLRQERPDAALALLTDLPDRHTDGSPTTTLAFFIYELKAIAAAWLGLVDQAEEAIRHVKELATLLGRPADRVQVAEARMLLHRDDHDEALHILSEFEANEPENFDEVADLVSRVRIDIAVDRADYKQAFEELQRERAREQRVRSATQMALNELQLGQESDRLRMQATALEKTNAELAESMKELRHLHQQVLEVSVRDPLTKLFNRRQLFVEAGLLMRLARRHDRPFSLAMVDVDRFKAVNDQHFHSTGDNVLCDLADILTSQARESDLVGRYGGDEFVVLLPEVDIEGAQVLCERIRSAVEANDWERVKPGLRVTVTIGIAQSVARESAEDLLHRADQRLFVAKKLGRNQVAS